MQKLDLAHALFFSGTRLTVADRFNYYPAGVAGGFIAPACAHAVAD